MRCLCCAQIALLFLLVGSPVFAQRQALSGHVPPLVKDLNLQPVERLSATNILHLAIGVPLRDEAGLKAFLQKLYDPTSPSFHQYLTPEQFAERFGPTEQDYEAVMAFAKSNGFQVTDTHPNRLLLDVDATAGDVENAFQVKLFVYQHPTEARTFYAPDVEPSIPAGIRIVDISGLTSFPRPHSNSHVGGLGRGAATPIPNAGSNPWGEYIGYDFRAAYVPGCPLTGTGQNVALVQFDGYYQSDITRYETLAGLPAITLTNVLLDGFSGVPTTGTLSGNGEVSLDIEMVNSMAPGISKLFLYEGNPNNFIPNNVLSRIANDNNSRQISSSWSWNGGPTNTTDAILMQMISQGQSFFVASGDSCAYPGSTVDNPNNFGTPCASSYITSVGGTRLYTAGPTNDWTEEVVWNWLTELGSAYNGVGSSGGYSAYYSIPTWQQGVPFANLGSATGRNFPDVALTGDHVFVAYGNGTTNWFGGTSCAAPLWAGFTALVNEQGAANGKSPVGFLNPALYAIGTGTSYTACFHDITSGNNEWSNSPNAYVALTGYDLCTGWGSPTGTNLINTLVGPLTNAYLLLTGSIVSGGNGNGVIDANECNSLNLIVQNIGITTATNVSAILTTATPGVTITQPFSTYSNDPAGGFATNATPFQVSTSPSFVCGMPVSLSLVLAYNGGSTTNTISLATCTSCPAIQVSGGLTASSPTQTGRLTRNYVVSSCSSSKSCPGYLTTTGAYRYQAYPFTNTTSSALCINVTITTPCAGQSSTGLFTAAYLGNFNPASLCSGYLGDQGGMTTSSGTYSFSVPANTNFTVVVNDVGAGSLCSSFTLTVAGLPCFVDGGGACAGPSARFTASPTNGVAPLAVTFTDTSTGSITNYFWSFGDGGTTNVTINNVVHTYVTPGVYSVTEIVAGPGGSSTNTQSNYITVLTPAPVAGFTATPTNGIAPLSVTFTDTSTGLITNWFWSFGDGGATNLTTNGVIYAYNTAGVYTVTEIVAGPGGSSTNTMPNYITVLTPFQGWQIQYFGSTNNPNAAPSVDADGTGQNNLFKYVAGLDPTNPSSVFLLTVSSDTNQPADLDLQFLPMANGRSYTPQFNTDLVNGVWSSLTTYTGPVTNGNQISVTDTNPLPPQEFYRIEISLP